LSVEDFLLGLFTDEIERRRSASAARRADDAGLGPDMVFERWDKTAKITFDRRILHSSLGILGPLNASRSDPLQHGELHG